MNVTGLLWTLYPLLGFLGFIEFFIGFAHIFFCLPFFIFFLPILSGVMAVITSVYALMLNSTNKTELLLQFLSAALSFLLFLTSITETSCLKRLTSEGGETSVCAGILNRTLITQTKCSEALNDFQDMFFIQIAKSKLLLIGTEPAFELSDKPNFVKNASNSADFIQPIRSVSSGRDAAIARTIALDIERKSMRIAISSILTLTSLIHLTSSIILTFYSVIMNNFHLSVLHWQTIFGILTLLFSYVYQTYCCIFFYTFIISAIAFYCLIQTAVPWHFPVRSVQRQLFSITGSALSMFLLSLTSFGFYCWSNRSHESWKFDRDSTNVIDSQLIWNMTEQKTRGDRIGLFRYCYLPKRLYLVCERTLQFSTPYIFWTQEQVESEEKLVQLIIYLLLMLNSLIHFFLFIYDAFGF